MPVVDTTFLIDVERSAPEALALARAWRDAGASVWVPAAVWTEYVSSFEAAKQAEVGARLDAATNFVAFDRRVAAAAARLQRNLAGVGRFLAWHDLQVAATALVVAEPLVTRDQELLRVPGIVAAAY